MINAFADRGVAVLVTTHYLEEAEQCNRLGFMVAGELVAEGSPSGVKAAQGGHLIELITDRPQAAADYLKRTRERWRISLFGDRLHVVVDAEPDPEIAQLKSELRAVDINVLRAYETAYSLEDVFISIVEKQQAANKKK
jgi:ABC-2 type transport system ATP-binding protein